MDFYRLSLYWIVYDIVNSVTSPHEHFSLRKSACNEWFMRTMKKRKKNRCSNDLFFFALNQDALRWTNRFFFGCNKLKHSNEVFGQVFAVFNFNYVFKTRCNENVKKRSGKKPNVNIWIFITGIECCWCIYIVWNFFSNVHRMKTKIDQCTAITFSELLLDIYATKRVTPFIFVISGNH